MIVEKLLSYMFNDIGILLSVGGVISGVLDYIFDKDINNVIWEFNI